MKKIIINNDEIEICGAWITNEGIVLADENCKRIEILISGYLKELGSDVSGWDRLYLDPNDRRYWELTYPSSDQHGGGPPCLKCITEIDVQNKYRHIFSSIKV